MYKISKRDEKKLKKLLNSQGFIAKNSAKLYTIEGFEDESNNLNAIVTKCTLADKLRNNIPELTTKDLNKLKVGLSKITFRILKKALGKCRAMKNTVLEGMFTFPARYIKKEDKIVCVVRAEEIVKKLKAKRSILTNITLGDIKLVEDAINYFVSVRDIPEMTKKNKISYGTNILKTGLNEGIECLKTLTLMIAGDFEESDPDLLNEFKEVNKVPDLGIRHTIVHVKMMDINSKVMIANGMMERTEKTGEVKIFTANSEGMIKFDTHKPGKTIYIFKAPNYHDKTVELKVLRGRINDVEVDVEKID